MVCNFDYAFEAFCEFRCPTLVFPFNFKHPTKPEIA